MSGPLSSWFDLGGTASRQRALILGGLWLAALTGTLALRQQAPVLAGYALLPFGALTILMVVGLVQRLHETGRSGYWVLLTPIPLVGLLVIVAILSLPKRDAARRAHPVAQKVGAGLLGLYALVVLTRVFLWQPFWIPAESMKPTLLVGDYLIATAVSEKSVERGDVIIFTHPVNGQDYIKRLIGLPGDRVQMQEGVVYINGVAAPQAAAGTFEEVFEPQGPMGNRPRCENGPVFEGGICTKSRFVETLPEGRKHDVLSIEAQGPADNTGAFVVPEGHYFLMGDNRDNSLDSRFGWEVGGIGFVPAENLKARARLVLFSSAGRFLWDVTSWRGDRFLKGVE